MKKDDDLVVFQEFYSSVEANIVKGVLETNGVQCIITNEVMSTSVFTLPDTSMGAMRLLVFQKDLELAHKIMESAPIDIADEE
ncbi:MAG: DUF2007 domain-containing protein [Muribaculaceae bacterium]